MSFSLVRLILNFCFSTIVVSNSLAEDNRAILKDYGVRGHTFPIIEQSLLEVIMTKLTLAKQKGLLDKMQDEFKKK